MTTYKKELTNSDRFDLIAEVLDFGFHQWEAWTEQDVGAHLAYLCLAIADPSFKEDSVVDWSEEGSPEMYCGSTPRDGTTLAEFAERFPPEHPVWLFIVTNKEKNK